jgi:hypothetical protein
MAGLVPATHVAMQEFSFLDFGTPLQHVDGPVKPGHDDSRARMRSDETIILERCLELLDGKPPLDRWPPEARDAFLGALVSTTEHRPSGRRLATCTATCSAIGRSRRQPRRKARRRPSACAPT